MKKTSRRASAPLEFLKREAAQKRLKEPSLLGENKRKRRRRRRMFSKRQVRRRIDPRSRWIRRVNSEKALLGMRRLSNR